MEDQQKTTNDSKGENKTFWILLVIASFIIGHLLTKSQYLEQRQNVSQAAVQKTNPQAAQAAPTIAPIIGAPNAPTTVSAENLPKVTSSDHLRGSANAQITLVEYSDLECPFCKRFHPTMQQVLKDYSDKVNWVYRHFPLPFHPNAAPAALASECANQQGGGSKFWKYVDGIFADANPLSTDSINLTAEKIGLDQAKFADCLQSKQFQSIVDGDLSGGQKAGVNGTPATFLINNKTGKIQLISGALPIEQIKQSIDAALASN